MMNTIITSLQNELQQLTEKAVACRKHFHMYPELSGREIQTSQFIEEQLLSLGITEIVRYPDYGLSALIKGPEDAPVVGIRAEMDALPIDEANDVDYASNNQGVMHACGHDVHMGIVLSVAGFFHQHREKLPVSIKLIFQPSEETLPGGAIQMINSGVLKNPEVNYMLGMHVLPEMKAGNVGFRPGIYMASSDEIFLTLIGKGGHAAMPHLLNDPVVCAAQILTSVQQVVSRRASPEIPSVLSFGKFIANGRTNVIPDVVDIEGTFRTFDEQWRKKAHKLITDIAVNSAAAAEIAADINIVSGYPVLTNDKEMTMHIRDAVSKILGNERIEELPLRMTTDDFAYYTQQLPCCYFRIGAGHPGHQTIRHLHTPLFDVHEGVFPTGIKALIAGVFSDFYSTGRE